MKKKRIVVASVGDNTVTAPDYGDPWVNRLALVSAVFKNMDERELRATLEFVASRHGFILSE